MQLEHKDAEVHGGMMHNICLPFDTHVQFEHKAAAVQGGMITANALHGMITANAGHLTQYTTKVYTCEAYHAVQAQPHLGLNAVCGATHPLRSGSSGPVSSQCCWQC
jgi:hypothetical protein